MRDSDITGVIAKAQDYMREQSYPEAISLCKEAIAELESESFSQENERRKMLLLFCLSDICHTSGNWVDGLMYLATVITKASNLSESDTMAEAIIRSGDILSKMGNWKKALDKYADGEKLVKKFKNPLLLGRVHVGMGTVLWRQGKYPKAMDNAETAYNIGVDIGSQRLITMSASLKASIYFDTREFEKAIEENDKAIEACGQLQDKIEIARILNNKGEVYKVMGDFKTAIGIFQQALDLLSNTMNCRSLAYLYTNLAECQVRRGEQADAEKTATLAAKNVNMSQDKYVKAQLLLVMGLVERGNGNIKQALAHIREAETIMRKLDIPYDMGVLHLEHARMLRDSDSGTSRDEYRNAIKSFNEANNTEKVRLATAELASLSG